MSFITDPVGDVFSGAKDIFIGDENKIAKPISRFQMPQFQTPGLGVTNVPGGFEIGRSPEVSGALGSLNQLSTGAAAEIGALRPLVAPGFGRMTEAGVQAIEDQRRSTVGDLRENLGRRRVLGSSFASDDISRTNAEFAKKDAQFRAETFLQELDASEKLITKQYETAIQGAQALINQSNFESEIGAELSRQYSTVMGDLAKYEASLLRDEADGQAGLLSGLLGLGLGAGGAALLAGGVGALAGGIGAGLSSVGSAVSGAVGGLVGAGAGSAVGGAAGLGIPAGAVNAGFGSGALASGAVGGGLGTIGAGSTGTLAGSVGGFGAGALDPTAASGAGLFGPSTGFSNVGAPVSGSQIAPIGIDAGGTGAATGGGAGAAPGTTGAEAAPVKGGLFTGASGAAVAGGGLAAAMALYRGEGFQQAVAQGGGAAAGAAAGFALTGGNPIGAILGGIAGGMLGGSLGKKLGLSASGGGDDKPDYSLGTGSTLDDGRALTSQSPWGTIGFGHQKHLTNNDRYQSGLDFITETDKVISGQLTPEENAKIKQAFDKHEVARNSNEGGFNPGRMMSKFFTDRAKVVSQALGPQRYSELGLAHVYTALSSGDQDKINQIFGVA